MVQHTYYNLEIFTLPSAIVYVGNNIFQGTDGGTPPDPAVTMSIGTNLLAIDKVTFTYTFSNSTINNGYIMIGNLTACLPRDTEGKTIPDYLDSDNDGCPDAVEGGADISSSQLVNADGTLQGGNGTNPIVTTTRGSYNQSVLLNLCATGAYVNTNGVPQLSPLPAGYSNATG